MGEVLGGIGSFLLTSVPLVRYLRQLYSDRPAQTGSGHLIVVSWPILNFFFNDKAPIKGTAHI